MSTENLNRNFEKFLKTIYHWPTPTIEKSILIKNLEELCRQNPELEHIYENVPLSGLNNSFSNNNNNSGDHSQLNTPNQSAPQNDNKSLTNNNPEVNANEHNTVSKESNQPPIVTLVKEGDLTVRKGSTILSPLLKKQKLKTSVYCELSYTYVDGEKYIYLIIFQNRKGRQMLHQFTIDDTCSFIVESKREFKFKHNSVAENFATETGTADTWLSSLREASIRRNTQVEDIYENPDEFSSDSESSATDYTVDAPARPPPRPLEPTNSISPEKIYVCLYDHYSTTSDPHELEFTCGDLLYIINTDGPNFYVGHRLILPITNPCQTPKGLVFKDYIKPAYEKNLIMERI